ncbi:hypothetical protein J2X04_002646 [Lysobacter niabensis]|uniref:Uncharacterized protein n=1 Tax=Agrilutibacter niabensis TaxID=380628 RepID=A0ABU1VSD1_9GAMM|nr:hypothetical protein [Lysobacter niabensis]MDR7100265.1 hypothetical protein [Lysobacter niabensis]
MNIWTGLLFLEGAVADVALARDLTDEAPEASAEDVAETGSGPRTGPTSTELH